MKKFSFLILLFLIPFISFANEVDFYSPTGTPVTQTLIATSTNTLHGLSVQWSTTATTTSSKSIELLCGENFIWGNVYDTTNGALKAVNTQMDYVCSSAIYFKKNNANIVTNVILVYSTGTSTIKINGFTQGELVISFFLTIFMMAGIFTFIINHFIYQKK